jgi:hypothetical protein
MRHPKRKRMSRWIKWCCKITATTPLANHTHYALLEVENIENVLWTKQY